MRGNPDKAYVGKTGAVKTRQGGRGPDRQTYRQTRAYGAQTGALKPGQRRPWNLGGPGRRSAGGSEEGHREKISKARGRSAGAGKACSREESGRERSQAKGITGDGCGNKWQQQTKLNC